MNNFFKESVSILLGFVACSCTDSRKVELGEYDFRKGVGYGQKINPCSKVAVGINQCQFDANWWCKGALIKGQISGGSFWLDGVDVRLNSFSSSDVRDCGFLRGNHKDDYVEIEGDVFRGDYLKPELYEGRKFYYYIENISYLRVLAECSAPH